MELARLLPERLPLGELEQAISTPIRLLIDDARVHGDGIIPIAEWADCNPEWRRQLLIRATPGRERDATIAHAYHHRGTPLPHSMQPSFWDLTLNDVMAMAVMFPRTFPYGPDAMQIGQATYPTLRHFSYCLSIQGANFLAPTSTAMYHVEAGYTRSRRAVLANIA
jgi:hypothetical protein